MLFSSQHVLVWKTTELDRSILSWKPTVLLRQPLWKVRGRRKPSFAFLSLQILSRVLFLCPCVWFVWMAWIPCLCLHALRKVSLNWSWMKAPSHLRDKSEGREGWPWAPLLSTWLVWSVAPCASQCLWLQRLSAHMMPVFIRRWIGSFAGVQYLNPLISAFHHEEALESKQTKQSLFKVCVCSEV